MNLSLLFSIKRSALASLLINYGNLSWAIFPASGIACFLCNIPYYNFFFASGTNKGQRRWQVIPIYWVPSCSSQFRLDEKFTCISANYQSDEWRHENENCKTLENLKQYKTLEHQKKKEKKRTFIDWVDQIRDVFFKFYKLIINSWDLYIIFKGTRVP